MALPGPPPFKTAIAGKDGIVKSPAWQRWFIDIVANIGLATGITRLIGDVTAGPGSGTQVATLAAGAVDLTTNVTGVLPVANGGTGTSTGPIIHTATVEIDDAAFKTLPSTYVEIVPAPGSTDLFLMPICAYLFLAATVPYTGVDAGTQKGLSVAYGDWDADALNFFVEFTGASFATQLTPIVRVPDAAMLAAEYAGAMGTFFGGNFPLKAIAWNSVDYGGGDVANRYRITVLYTIWNSVDGSFS